MEHHSPQTAPSGPLVSIIIPTYNDAALLPNAINSVLAQTYPSTEIIVVNDGSDDGGATDAVAGGYGERIRYFATENRGSAAARNLGIEKATGAYIAFLDADDFFLSQKIEKQLAYMLEGSYCFCHTSYVRRNAGTGEESKITTKASSGKAFPGIIECCRVATPTVMVKRDALGTLRFPEDFTIGEDVCLWIDLSFRYPLGQIDDGLTVVVVDEDTTALSGEKSVVGYLNILRYVYQNPEYAKNILETDYLYQDLRRMNILRLGLSKREKRQIGRKKVRKVLLHIYYAVLDTAISLFHMLFPGWGK